MATNRSRRHRRSRLTASLPILLLLPLVLLPALAAAEPARPVAFYDADAVLARASVVAGEHDARLVRLVARHEAELSVLREQVDALRLELVHATTLPMAVRRDVESRLAERTVALLVEETEGGREIEVERRRVTERLQGGVAAVVARVASERGLPVVVRTDADTVVLDPDAVDLTDAVLTALGAGPRLDEDGPIAPDVRGRTRLQACAPVPDESAPIAAR